MSKVVIDPTYLAKLSALDASIDKLHIEKLRIIFKVLALKVSPKDFEKLMQWDLILISVLDKQMAVQLNKLSAYMPNLKFVVDADKDLFSIFPGEKPRRVWKERVSPNPSKGREFDDLL